MRLPDRHHLGRGERLEPDQLARGTGGGQPARAEQLLAFFTMAPTLGTDRAATQESVGFEQRIARPRALGRGRGLALGRAHAPAFAGAPALRSIAAMSQLFIAPA